MAAKRWIGLSDVLESVLNDEYFADSDDDSIANEDLGPELNLDIEYDTECDIENRTAQVSKESAHQLPTGPAATSLSFATAAASSSQPVSQDEDEVFAQLRQVMHQVCCPKKCWDNFSINEVYSHVLSMRELEKSEKEMFIMGKLSLCSNPDDSTKHARKKRKGEDVRVRTTYKYQFDQRAVCQTAFIALHDSSIRVLKALQNHVKEYGPTPRTHKLKGT